jgi:hypothetical protein
MTEIIKRLNNVLSLEYFKQNKVTIISALLIFYMGAPATGDHLLASQLRDVLSENRLAQHSLGFLKMFISMILVGSITDTGTALIYAVIAYSWFILTTKLDLEWNAFILLLLLLGFLYENQLIVKEEIAQEDQVLTKDDKDRINERHKKYKTYILLALFVLTIVGTLVYGNKKVLQYGDSFNLKDFLFNDRNR